MYGWQSMQASSYATSGEDPFYQFCDAIETHSNGKIEMSAKGVGMPTALHNYAKWMYTQYGQFCSSNGGACYSSYDYSTDHYKDWSVGNSWDRQWYWMVCNEFGFFQGTSTPPRVHRKDSRTNTALAQT